MCYPVCGMMHVKEPLLLIGKCNPCGDGGFPLLLIILVFCGDHNKFVYLEM